MSVFSAISKAVLSWCIGAAAYSSVAAAGHPALDSWREGFDNAAECVEQSYPDSEGVINCYSALAEKCLTAELQSFEDCLAGGVASMKQLLAEFGSHENSEKIEVQYDPKKCGHLDIDRVTQLQCQFTAYFTRAVHGHTALVWRKSLK